MVASMHLYIFNFNYLFLHFSKYEERNDSISRNESNYGARELENSFKLICSLYKSMKSSPRSWIVGEIQVHAVKFHRKLERSVENRPEDNSSRRFSAFPLDHGPATAIESVDRGRWMSKKLRIFRGERGERGNAFCLRSQNYSTIRRGAVARIEGEGGEKKKLN